MNKNKRESAEKILFDTYIKSNPKLKTLLESLGEEENIELKDIIKPIIEKNLNETRMIGINIGYMSAILVCEDAIKNMDGVDEIKSYIKGKAKEAKDRLNLKDGEDD